VAAAPKRFQTLLSIGGGYDDNVTLSADLELLDFPASEDEFGEALVASQIQLRGNRENGERLVLTGYIRRHEEIDEFNQSVAQASVFMDRKLGSWYTTAGIGGDTVYLDDERFTSSGTGTLEARHLLPYNSAFGLRYQGSYIDAPGIFESISGQRHAMRGTLTNRYKIAQTQLGYEFEINDRKDLELDDGQFYSRSPQSHTVFLANATQLTRRLSLQPRIEYRHSRYPDDDQRLFLISPATEDDPAVLGIEDEQRRDNRIRAVMRAELLLTKSLFLHGQYEYTDNRSNYEEFKYERNTVSGGIGASF
jgi:hypothetical protein